MCDLACVSNALFSVLPDFGFAQFVLVFVIVWLSISSLPTSQVHVYSVSSSRLSQAEQRLSHCVFLCLCLTIAFVQDSYICIEKDYSILLNVTLRLSYYY